MANYLTFGEIMLELSELEDGLYRKNFAGDSFNVAYYLKKIGADSINVNYLTKLGQDTNSQDCLKFIEKNGVGTSEIRRTEQQNIGLFILSNDEHGEKQYGYWRGQSAAKYLFEDVIEIKDYDLLQFSGISAAVCLHRDHLIASIKTAKQNGVKIVYDYNHRGQLWSALDAVTFAEKVMPIADLIKISDEELELLYPNLGMQDLSRNNNAEWLLTKGGDGAEIWQNGEQIEALEFTPVDHVVDSSAAGDSFLAGYLIAEQRQKTKKQCLEYGHYIASQVINHKGSIAPIVA